MPKETPFDISAPDGKLAVLLPGLGAVSTTFIAGVLAVRKGLGKPIGSLTQMGAIRLGKRTEKRAPMIKDFVPLSELSDLTFAAWDIFEEDAYQSAVHAGVLERTLLGPTQGRARDHPAAQSGFDQEYVKKLNGTHVKTGSSKMDLAEQLMEDIASVKRKTGAERAVMIWCASTETFLEPSDVHRDVEAFEAGLRESAPAIAPSMIYAYAAIKSGVPFANGAPNLTVDVPALTQLASDEGVPIGGKDFKTGQTLIKTILAPGLKARMLGLAGCSLRTSSATATAKCSTIRARSRRKRSRSYPSWNISFSRSSIRTSMATSTTRSASTITRRAETTKKAGIILTSSVGSAIRCRSKSTSFAGILSSRPHSCSTSLCSTTWRSARASKGSRNGSRSTSRAQWPPGGSIRSTTCSFSSRSSKHAALRDGRRADHPSRRIRARARSESSVGARFRVAARAFVLNLVVRSR